MPAVANVVFPPGFVWGAATASYQIEGATGADGRSPSIWDTFSHTPGRTHNGDNGDVACDHYRRLDEDLDLLAALGVGSYRFSVAWPRVQPDGKGPANPAGLDFYRRLVGGLRDRGIAPTATLYHWDLPQALEDAGGWVARDTAERFAEYAAVVGEALGDGVERWITVNEPWCSSFHGYGNGLHAPGRTDTGAAVAAVHHLLLGHGKAVEALRAGGARSVGITLNLVPVRAASEHEADAAAARRMDGYANRMFLDPLFRGRYPSDMAEAFSSARPGLGVVEPGDLEVIGQPLDFLGVNYYSPAIVADPSRLDEARRAGLVASERHAERVAAELGVARVVRAGSDRTAMDWEIEPSGLTDLLVGIARDYPVPPLYVTENGAAFCDYVDPDGRVQDPARVEYLDGHLRAVAQAIGEGVEVRGYFCWSLLDNFEWAYGFAKRFGLVWVDYATGARIPKSSFSWYRDVIAANGLA